MRRYLATLHKRPRHHQKHFALAVSSGVTLLIFGVWVLVNYGNPMGNTETEQVSMGTLGQVEEVSPLESMGESLAASWASLRDAFGGLTENLRGIDMESGYDEMKQKTLETYGQ